MDPTPWVGAGSVVALMALAISFVLTAYRGQGKRARESERNERRAQRRIDILVRACREGGVDVPAEVWSDKYIDEEVDQ